MGAGLGKDLRKKGWVSRPETKYFCTCKLKKPEISSKKLKN
jgi:hypothetical protein